MKCARHPSVDTDLTCSSCDTPICPSCSVVTPVGHKCPTCAKPDRSIQDVPPNLALRGFVATLFCAFLAGFIVNFGFLYFIMILAYGWVVGEAAYSTTKRRTGKLVEFIAGISVPIGLFGSKALLIYTSELAEAVQNWPEALGMTSPFYLAGMAIAVIIAVSRVRSR